MPTPILTDHARERCAEMGIRTRVAKRIVRHATVRYPGGPDARAIIALSDWHPEYAVVYVDDQGDRPVVLTVLFRTPERYERAGETFVPRSTP